MALVRCDGHGEFCWCGSLSVSMSEFLAVSQSHLICCFMCLPTSGCGRVPRGQRWTFACIRFRWAMLSVILSIHE